MGNPNYQAGRREEYATQRKWEEAGYSTIRASGSHGKADVVAFRPDRKPELIQCKVTKTEAEAKRLIKDFKSYTIPSSYYHQVISVKIKRGETLTWTI